MQTNQPSIRSALMRVEPARMTVGVSRGTWHAQVLAGLLPKPVRVGARACAVPVRELEAVNAYRIAGKSDGEIKTLVARLFAERRLDA